jgi:hypothetical protein
MDLSRRDPNSIGPIDRPWLDGDRTGGGLGGRIMGARTPEWNKRASGGSLSLGTHSRLPTGSPGTAGPLPEFIERYSGAIGPVRTILVCNGAWTLSPR